MRQKQQQCRVPGCIDMPFSGGLCRTHSDQKRADDRRNEAALRLLDKGTIDDHGLENAALREELDRLRRCWFRVCAVAQSGRDAPFLKFADYQYANGWCLTLAKEILDAEAASRDGRSSSDAIRTQMWERLKDIESALKK